MNSSAWRLVAQIQVDGGEAIVAGKQQLRLVGLLGERERFPVVRDRAGRIAVTLVDLPEHDQRHRQVIELPEAPVEIDRGVRGADALLVAAVGERAVGHREVRVEARLEPEVADLLGHLEAGRAGLDRPGRIERAVEHAQVREPATGGLQQPGLPGEGHAALDVRDRLLQPAQAGAGHAERVVALRGGGHRFRAPVRVERGVGGEPLGVEPGLLRPLDGPLAVAAAEGQPAHLLVEVRLLDVLAIVAEQGEPGLEALERPRPRAGVPVEAPHLAKDPRLGRRVPRRAVSGLDDLVLAERGRPPSGRAEQVGHALSGHEPLRLDRRRSARARRAPADSAGSRPRWRTCRAPSRRPPSGSARPGACRRRGPSGGRGPPAARDSPGSPAPWASRAVPTRRVQLGATGHEDVLVHDLLEEPVAEPVIRPRRHQIGAARARRAPRPPRRARPRPPSAATPRSGGRSPPLPG